jgi:hypothetical protein
VVAQTIAAATTAVVMVAATTAVVMVAVATTAAKLVVAVLTTAVAIAAAVATLEVLLLLQKPLQKLHQKKLLRSHPRQRPIQMLGSLNLARWSVLASFANRG